MQSSIYHYEIENESGLKSQQLFIQMIERRTVKFNYCKVFVPYGMSNSYYIKFNH